MSDRTVNRRIFLSRSATVAAGAAALTALPTLTGGAVAGATTPAAAAARPSSRPTVPDITVRAAARKDPTEATLAEAVVLLRTRKLTATALVDAHLDRITKFESVYQAFNAVTADAARARAAAVDRGHVRGLLAGVPLTIKDNYYTAGIPTTANSFIFQDFVPPYDATSVARLTGAGAIVIGKGQMGPLATTRATQPNGVITTVNAWTPGDPSVDPGGSSTGPACSVAGRMACSSIGTQTGGSIVLPSNQQNLTGLKPTMGRTSIYGVIPLSYTRDHSGPLARDVLDAAVMLSVMAGPDRNDPRTLGLPAVPDLVASALPVRRGGKVVMRRSTRIGVPADFLTGVTDPVKKLRTDFLNTMAKIPGAKLVDVTYPNDWALLTGTFNAIRLSERTEPFLPYLQKDLTLFGVSLLSWLQGIFLSGDEWITGQRAKNHLIREVLDGVMSKCDVLLQTSVVPFDILGLPEIGFPIGFQALGANPTVPVGGILGAGPYEEDRLIEVVAAYQASTDWHLRRPADPVLPAITPKVRAAVTAGTRLTPEYVAANGA
ncbi:aspartyl-tRNA(Asn)/glutamyl-tRNA(Gln) amidotransferase subunit A [Nakamurella panacisegetis]|uniref:Aspartyl-tRNA(Asn)/glutamyl-tRNA(Gln) amidotransferase subunit A n=1 Tax=Nakamurella panacisegetis TaxID=1090615 RepID=A0A1H0SSI9_9ACTN|nr:amidase [Nakamurella panacisegetis]SDP44711.1 aspartyl-tRNA(Asn)/glutamyl-tRNA(Gln) amidotransferase subunit A [Nakamurella panacisegetis]